MPNCKVVTRLGVGYENVDVGRVHDVEGARLRNQHVEYVDIVQLALGNMDKRRDIATQIQKRVQLDPGLPDRQSRGLPLARVLMNRTLQAPIAARD